MFHYDRICGSRCFLGWKTSLSPEVGGTLPEILGYEKAEELIREADEIYLKFGADEKVYGLEDMEAIDEIRAKSIRANLKLIECPIRHLGTEEGYKIYARLQKHLEENRVEIRFMTMVQNILMEKDGQSELSRKKERLFMRRRSWRAWTGRIGVVFSYL